MKKSTALRLFNNSVRELAYALNVSTQAVRKWGENIPDEREKQLRQERPELFGKRTARA